ncbi:hypothetical protein DICPUDRAFT_75643 [Dictyostelium purpureum]|uniref:Uncharacterized protein n=1 Tax=Dictyostelium purpureum TaxID=5786 RepID=F0ZB90_DICPU|nr:uncharacterized protein DICPUDRAFT_75643 [Dictyostelium purpureum]EGC38780.1 hypothetical protein DICPUDRAFT_75643 [Dictyostelium purpureum]|eukprot:XP_003284674.1 hypothetical protein DICPUDRAFT_75643 [Dictyostelium purpureum]
MDTEYENNFFKVFRNKYLINKIFNIIYETEIENNYNFYFGHRLKFKRINDLFFITEKGLWEILRMKLLAKESIIMDCTSIQKFIASNKDKELLKLTLEKIKQNQIINNSEINRLLVQNIFNRETLEYLLCNDLISIDIELLLFSIKSNNINSFQFLIDHIKHDQIDPDFKKQMTMLSVKSSEKFIKSLYNEKLFVSLDTYYKNNSYKDHPKYSIGFKEFIRIHSNKAKKILLDYNLVSLKNIKEANGFSFTFENLTVTSKLLEFYIILYFKLLRKNYTNNFESDILPTIINIKNSKKINENEKIKHLLEIFIKSILEQDETPNFILPNYFSRSIFTFYIENFGFDLENEKLLLKVSTFIFETLNENALIKLFSILKNSIDIDREIKSNSFTKFFNQARVLPFLKQYDQQTKERGPQVVFPKKIIKLILTNSDVTTLNEILKCNLIQAKDYSNSTSFHFLNSKFETFKWYINEFLLANQITINKKETISMDSIEKIDFIIENYNNIQSLITKPKFTFSKLKYIKYYCEKAVYDPSYYFYKYLKAIKIKNQTIINHYRLFDKAQVKGKENDTNKIEGLKSIKEEKIKLWLQYISEHGYSNLSNKKFKNFILILYSYIKDQKLLKEESMNKEYKSFKIMPNYFPAASNEILKSTIDICMVKLILENGYVIKENQIFSDYQFDLDKDDFFSTHYQVIEYLLNKLTSGQQNLFNIQFNRLYSSSLQCKDITFNKIQKLDELFHHYSVPIYKDSYHTFLYLKIKSEKFSEYFLRMDYYHETLSNIYRNSSYLMLENHDVLNEINFPMQYIKNSTFSEIFLKLNNLTLESINPSKHQLSDQIHYVFTFLASIHSPNIIEILVQDLLETRNDLEPYWLPSFTQNLLRVFEESQIPKLIAYVKNKKI